MSFTITQRETEKWRIAIEETWEFEIETDFNETLEKLIDFKKKFGHLQRKIDQPQHKKPYTEKMMF